MDEIERLLETTINLHYHNRPSVVVKAAQLIQEYCDKEKTNITYDEVLKGLHDLMVDLPPSILLYFLTTVPQPTMEEGSNRSKFLDLMKKSRDFLSKSINFLLTDYLSKKMPPLIAISESESNSEEENKMESESEIEDSNCQNRESLNSTFDAITASIEPVSNNKEEFEESNTSTDMQSGSCKNLLDICAEYVISNLDNLNQFYKEQSEIAWNKINNNHYVEDDQKIFYSVIQDINKKRNWLRMIDVGHISGEELKEQYGESGIQLKECYSYSSKYNYTSQDAKKLMDVICMLIKS